MTEEPARTPAARLRRAGAAARNTKDAVANAVAFHRADGLHLAKTTLAAVLAWAAAHWLTMAESAVWMGPATAVIVVQTTVYRSLANGARRVGAVTAGVMIAGLVGRLLGLNAISLIIIVPSALLAARWRRIGDHGVDIVTTAVLMLSYGASAARDQYLRDYVLQTAVGAAAGVLVNFVIPPPLQVRRPYAQLQSLTSDTTDLLERISAGLREGYGAEDVREWQAGVDDLDGRLSDAAASVQHGAESRRFNARRLKSPAPAPHLYRPLLRAMRLIMPSVNSIVRTLDYIADDRERDPDAPALISETFAHAYAGLLECTAEAIGTQGRNPAVSDDSARRHVTRSLQEAAAIHDRMTDLVRDGRLSRPRGWAANGSLLTDAERILSTLTWCADALEETGRVPARRRS
jgi:uncharacterized membrane protein YgaE (UPF0421/DUF939 family)